MAEQVRLCYDRDGHPSKNKHREIFQARKGRGYPPIFLELLDPFKCETCAVTASAREYRQSERVKTKGYHKSNKKTVKPPDAQAAKVTDTHPPPCASCTPTCPCCTDVGTDGAAQLAKCSHMQFTAYNKLTARIRPAKAPSRRRQAHLASYRLPNTACTLTLRIASRWGG